MSDDWKGNVAQPVRQTATSQVRSAIEQASTRTGVDFGYLVGQAKVESGMDANAKAPTSSASGLYQFIESTWLDMMRRHGSSFGLDQIASKIGKGPNGPVVSSPALRAQILALRNDPQIASLMAGALAQENGDALRPVLGRAPDAGELYLAHFLGSGGASKFLTRLQTSPSTSAASLFPKAAVANRSIFYTKGGAPRSLENVMGLLRRKIETAMPNGGAMSGADYFASPLNSDITIARSWPTATPQMASSAYSGYSAPGYSPAPRSSAVVRFADGSSASIPKLSNVLRDSFSAGTFKDAGRAGDHVQRAYAKLKAFNL